MRLYGDLQQRLGKQLQQRSILDRVLIDTSMVIIVGAVGGPLLTRYLSHLSPQAGLWLTLFFAALGIMLGLITDYLIVKTTLHPMDDLIERFELVGRHDPGAVAAGTRHLPGSDPDGSRS